MAGSSGRQKAASRPTKASKRVPAEKLPDLKLRGERTPLEHLLALMNDSSLPPMRSAAIAGLRLIFTPNSSRFLLGKV